jgi:hypothetical protein
MGLKDASEFGGKPGLVQSEDDGHVKTPAELLSESYTQSEE